jgi:hypothetical protein
MTSDPEDFTFDGCRAKLRDATRIVIDKEGDYARAIARKADAEAVYRDQLAKVVRSYRKQGKAVEESMTLARADCATLSRERDYAADMTKLAAERLEGARDSRRSLWRLVEWARDRDVATLAKQNGGPSS